MEKHLLLYCMHRFCLKTKQILKEFKPDIVHLNNFLNIASPSILCCLKNIPAILTIHDYSIICPTGYKMLSSKVCNSSYGKNCIKCIGIKGYYYDAIKHRGPDDSEIFADSNLTFSHQRLSTIDLSLGVHQPFVYNYKNKKVVIVVNGVIYNWSWCY
ncbi:unnamed protein product [marine sediment metagenome]|uniref:Glutamine amidotransferase type-2 domain-containing protein n=1 Tax=marine sediment metagenome TaxID=412755 RepID=X1T4X4_9ZZZZ